MDADQTHNCRAASAAARAGALAPVARMYPIQPRLFWRVIAAADYAFTVSALWLHDRIAGPAPEPNRPKGP